MHAAFDYLEYGADESKIDFGEDMSSEVSQFLSYWSFPVSEFWKSDVQGYLDEAYAHLDIENRSMLILMHDRQYQRDFNSGLRYDVLQKEKRILVNYGCTFSEIVECLRSPFLSSVLNTKFSKRELLSLVRMLSAYPPNPDVKVCNFETKLSKLARF